MTAAVRDATPDDVEPAANALALAFDTYPWTRWSIPVDDYRERLRAVQGIYLRHALTCGLVLVDDEVQGVAAFLPPDAPDPGTDDQARIADLLGDRLEAVLAAELPGQPAGAWSLATIGVHPDRWGRGIASALLGEGLRRLDASGVVIALETSRARNVDLYRRHGFTVTATTEIPDGPVVHAMRRLPAAP